MSTSPCTTPFTSPELRRENQPRGTRPRRWASDLRSDRCRSPSTRWPHPPAAAVNRTRTSRPAAPKTTAVHTAVWSAGPGASSSRPISARASSGARPARAPTACSTRTATSRPRYGRSSRTSIRRPCAACSSGPPCAAPGGSPAAVGSSAVRPPVPSVSVLTCSVVAIEKSRPPRPGRRLARRPAASTTAHDWAPPRNYTRIRTGVATRPGAPGGTWAPVPGRRRGPGPEPLVTTGRGTAPAPREPARSRPHAAGPAGSAWRAPPRPGR